MMIGAVLTPVEPKEIVAAEVRPAIRLQVAGLDVPARGPFGVALHGIRFAVAAGEVLGIAGVAGNGQSELLGALAGEIAAADPGMISLDGRAIGRLGIAGRRRLGLCSVPEERNGHAAVPDLSLTENAVLTARHRARLGSRGFIRFGAARRFAAGVIARFGVKATGPGAVASSLSGGNLQKFVMGREIMQEPGVLVVAQPTWGVDAGAAGFIHQAILDLASRGAAIVVISQDLDELRTLSDRLAVLNEGRLSPAMARDEASPERIGLLMGGIHGLPAADAARNPASADAVA
jgi:simple sugar transport system ATP-binding protein